MRVLITGANRGIGRALFDGYAARGDEVIGTCRDTAPAVGHWERLDVADPASQAALARHLSGHPIDLLICNAGVYLDKAESLENGYPAPMWADTLATNVTGVFLTIQSLLPNLRAAPAARIAIISSQMGSDALAPGRSYIYRASKAAALNLGRNLAADLAPEGIAVGIYHPGWVRTDMGGAGATISTGQARDGLIRRFDALTPGTTGCFETWDGTPHPF